MTERDLSRIFKAYDVRGVVPDDLDVDLVRSIGAAYARITDARPILIGRDCRLSSPEFAAALADGVTSQASDAIDLGLTSTDLLYFASGSLEAPLAALQADPGAPPARCRGRGDAATAARGASGISS